MGATTATVKPTTSIEQIAARLSFGAAATSLLLLAALHVVSPEFDPSWRMVSEYALGKFGWVLTLMFVSLALSCAALFVAIRSSAPTIAGKAGLAFLLAAVVGMFMAALFDWQHNLHGLAALIGNPSFTLAALLISVSLVRVYNGQVSIIDGPVAETKEQIIRKFTINARDLNEAIQVATTMPQARGGPIEVRPILAVRPTRSAPFTGGHAPKGLKLIDVQTFSTGVVHLIYAPAEPA